MNPYTKLLNRKRTWTPVQTTAGKVREGSEETIYRALAIRHMELPVETLFKMLSKLMSLQRRVIYSYPTLKTRKSTTLLSVTSPILSGLMRRLKPKPSDSGKRGLLILITPSSKRWLPNVQFSSCSSHSCDLMVIQECEQLVRT